VTLNLVNPRLSVSPRAYAKIYINDIIMVILDSKFVKVARPGHPVGVDGDAGRGITTIMLDFKTLRWHNLPKCLLS
jgi:hypothetical protein